MVNKTKKCKIRSISELAGRWKMSDEEAKKFLKDTKKGWRIFKI
jgi:hypothetical protein